MTVGQELSKITELKLFHNHMMIEPVLEIFGSFNVDVIVNLRKVIFDAFVDTKNVGMIFTMMWAFDRQEDWEYVKSITDLFSEVYYVELVASQNIRLERNKTVNRLTHKPSKRNLIESENRILNNDQKIPIRKSRK